MKKIILKIGLLMAVIISFCCQCQKPDLMVKDLVVTWTEAEQKVSFKVVNKGLVDAGEFFVYINAEEDPVSSNHRPQLREHVEGLAGGDEVVFTDLDFSVLAHPDNNYLGNVYEIVVVADAKGMVDECSETNNTMSFAVSPISIDCGLETAFESLTAGTRYNTLGATFISDNVECKTVQYMMSGGTPSPGGLVEVQNRQMAGGSGLDLWTNNMNVEFILPFSVSFISFNAGHYGGNMNLSINGNFHFFNDVGSINGMNLGGVAITTTGGYNTPGIWEFNGPVTSFYVGGQEFGIDNVCIK